MPEKSKAGVMPSDGNCPEGMGARAYTTLHPFLSWALEEYGFIPALGVPTLEVGHNEVVIDLGALDHRALRVMARSLRMRRAESALNIEDLKKELGLELEASERLAKKAADFRAKWLDARLQHSGMTAHDVIPARCWRESSRPFATVPIIIWMPDTLRRHSGTLAPTACSAV